MIQDQIGRERDKKILDPKSGHTRTGGKNSEKKQQKNSKIKKKLSGFIFSQNGMRQDEIDRERDKRILDPNSAHTRPGGGNSEKKSQKNSKNQRTTSRHYSQPNRDETGREREKRNLDPYSAYTQPRGENSEKNAKKLKKLKNNIPALFLAKTG